ncbi:xanthine dehydrogenase family protein molybdopterin-binding subunit [Trichlorobacter lovleyi]|uniref:xanthine dehydrogenase family protein molybdopterin-binding subunit n=1 Tax=Trichlorobacter lovleyi TaxID=313985 RepID=UPI00224057E9|nr:xanthine dehydrogenase family protein molybdopterin-binding subunit [Trichlorobacter lovleyi]QOX80473.1 xanthine dehydrogenase family protein molybdopterin-binding subunit [Trichlorobacter lovleyi]
MSRSNDITRRQFIKAGALLSGGLVLACHLPFGRKEALAGQQEPFAPNAFLRISPDERVTIIVNKSEMGQGVYTSLPMLVAEELCCNWKKVGFVPSPVAPEYNHTQFGPIMVTGGSTSVRSEWSRLSLAGAAAREMLIAAAALTWKVDPAACRAENGYVIGPAGAKLSYGKLVKKAATLPVPKNPQLKAGKKTLLGTPAKRLDSPAKINGTAIFGIDVQEPGMLTAVIARSPVFGGKVVSVHADKAKAVAGVRSVVTIEAGVVVAADDFWQALKGREQLEITWDEGRWNTLATPVMHEQYARLAETPGLVARKDGDAAAYLDNNPEKIEAVFEMPYLAHATMEPLNCFVDLKKDSALIRTGSQFQTVDRAAAARVAGLKPEQIVFETTFLGGGFGRRGNPASDFVVEAVQAAKALNRPVKVVYTREDDMRSGYYRPMWYNRVEAALDKKGYPLAWRHRIVGQSIITGTSFESAMVKNGIDHTSVEGAADTPYAIPNLQVELHSTTNGVPVLWWRSVGHSHTAFVMESFMDELAHKAGIDPYRYRRTLLAGHPRNLKVLQTAAEKAGWGKALPEGHARGIAVHESFGSYAAQVAEVSLNKGGGITVHRVVCAIDCGRIVNPDTIKAQMESGIIFGLSAALHGAITLKNGRVEQGNFDSYPLVRMNAAPRIEVHIIPSNEAPGGVGEPGVPPIAPAVANALFALTGARVRTLPMTPERVRSAMAAENRPQA